MTKSEKVALADYERNLWSHRHCRRPTNEDWAPTLPGGTVYLFTTQLSDGRHRIVVGGADDFGMERDVATASEAEALLRRIPIVVALADLVALGFRRW